MRRCFWEVVLLKGGCCCHFDSSYQLTIFVGPPHPCLVAEFACIQMVILKE